MAAKCCNPLCAHSFRYLTDGKLFRLENDPALSSSALTREYFWLCPSCSATMTLKLSNQGRVIAVPLSKRLDVDVDTDFSSRKKGLLLSYVRILGRKGMAKVQHSSSEAIASS
jgi:hypothetical protein